MHALSTERSRVYRAQIRATGPGASSPDSMFRERKGRGGVLTWIKTAAAEFRFARVS
jgi:hypothetical protein